MTIRKISLSFALLAWSFASGCAPRQPTDALGGGPVDPGSPSALYEHPGTDPKSQTAVDRKVEEQAVGSPEVYARLHACGKIPVRSLGRFLLSRGVSPSGAAYQLYEQGRIAMGSANYGSRTPETIIASTANLTKQFDVLVTAAPEILKNAGAPTGACPGVVVHDGTTFTKDGLACLMGKPAKGEHVFLANQAVKDGVAQGLSEDDAKAIAVATVLQAAHTCE